ncbi:hypothetical protein [Ensifer sp. Root31]|uniref:hypothetical protein n=1 Tax=Ensifer sp. Root31 TaxID=1736512 RepID=UPI0012E937FF|nr:hypothetical protein [Ensifer sp. Root31]
MYFVSKGHGWHPSDKEADVCLSAAFQHLGLKRPTWLEGQWAYTAPHENCLRCNAEIDEEDQARGLRFCSDMCAQAARAHRDRGERSWNDWVFRKAWQEIKSRNAPPRPCEQCGKTFREYDKTRRFCSVACKNEAITVLPDIECPSCQKMFHPTNAAQKCCSLKCAGLNRNREYRANAPETSCAVCHSIFRTTKPGQVYCSTACRRSPEVRRATYLASKAQPRVARIDLPEQVCPCCESAFRPHRKGVTYCSVDCREGKRRPVANVIYLTPEMFDRMFDRPRVITAEVFDRMFG